MPSLVRPTREELQYLRKLHKETDITDEMLSDLYESCIDREDTDNIYRLIYCEGCGDFVGECGIAANDERHEALLYIEPSMRRSGYGTAVLKMLQKEAAERGIKTLYAHVPEDEETLRFVKNRGFRPENDRLWKISAEEKAPVCRCRCRADD